MLETAQGGGGVEHLVTAGKPRRGQISRKPAALEMHGHGHRRDICGDVRGLRIQRLYIPVIVEIVERRPYLFGLGPNHGLDLRLLGGNDSGDAGFEDSRLFPGDGGKGGAQKLHVVDGNGGNGSKRRFWHHIGGIEPAPQPGFQKQDIGWRTGKGQERRGGGDFEKGNGLPIIDGFAFLEQFHQFTVVNEPPGKANSFAETHEMGRGVDMGAVSRRLEKGVQEGNGGPLTIGSRHMNYGGQFFLWPAQLGQQFPYPLQREIDFLGMQADQALENGFSLFEHLSYRWRGGPACRFSCSCRSSSWRPRPWRGAGKEE